jgi:hypothetical protein
MTKRLDERSYEVQTPESTYRRNRVHLKKTAEPQDIPEQTPDLEPVITAGDSPITPLRPVAKEKEQLKLPCVVHSPVTAIPKIQPTNTEPGTPYKTRAGRICKRPARLC